MIFEFKIDGCLFKFYNLPIHRQEEAKTRAKFWLRDCLKAGKNWDMFSFSSIEQLPLV